MTTTRESAVAAALARDADLAGYIRDARSTEDPCAHWVGQSLAVCAPCLRDRIAPAFTAAVLAALDTTPQPALGDDEAVAEAGMALIRAERRRQIDIEGYTPEHDAAHGGFVLSQAAHCYEAWGWVGRLGGLPDQWPWGREAWKPRDPISDLIRAGALFLAAHEQGYPTGWTSAQRCATNIDTAAAILAARAHQPTAPAQTEAVAALDDDVCDALMAAIHGKYDGLTVGAHLERLLRTIRGVPSPATTARAIADTAAAEAGSADTAARVKGRGG